MIDKDKKIIDLEIRKKILKDKIKDLEEELKYYKDNAILICGVGSEDDDDGSCAKELGVEENETFFNFDAEGFIEDALMQIKSSKKYDRVFSNGDEE